MNRAVVLVSLERFDEAVDHHDKTIEIFEKLIYLDGKQELLHKLATTLLNKADVLKQCRAYPEALALHDRAIILWKQVIREMELESHRPALANAYRSKALILRALNDLQPVIHLCIKARKILHILVHEEKKKQFEDELEETESLLEQLNSMQGLHIQ